MPLISYWTVLVTCHFMGPVNRRNSQYFMDWKCRTLYWTYPYIRGKELGVISRNAADSQPGVSRYDQKPWVGVRCGKFINELVKGCHTRPFGCSYVVWLGLSLQGWNDSNHWLLISYKQWLFHERYSLVISMEQILRLENGRWYCWQ